MNEFIHLKQFSHPEAGAEYSFETSGHLPSTSKCVKDDHHLNNSCHENLQKCFPNHKECLTDLSELIFYINILCFYVGKILNIINNNKHYKMCLHFDGYYWEPAVLRTELL
jgi:hypothetical protein